MYTTANDQNNTAKTPPDIDNENYMQELCKKYHVFDVEPASLEGNVLYVALGILMAFITILLVSGV